LHIFISYRPCAFTGAIGRVIFCVGPQVKKKLLPLGKQHVAVKNRVFYEVSNDWKNGVDFFQSLELFFAFFPIIGKNGLHFSNDWKKVRACFPMIGDT